MNFAADRTQLDMAPNTPLPLVKVEIGKTPDELGLHNRWHPEIPAVRITLAASRQNVTPSECCVTLQLPRTFPTLD